jgi:hypothetical protein
MSGIALNEDDSHYYFSRAGQKLDAGIVASWVDGYAKTQVRELLLNPQAMRTVYPSKVWDPIWKDYDPNGPDDQPLLKSLPPEGRKGPRGWIHTAWQLFQDGIDPYRIWIDRSRQKKISPWISMRMNDSHGTYDEQSYLHNEFWRNNPQFRRVPYRSKELTDKSLDYAHKEVREHHMKLVKELVERYDFDGLELDWMRFAFHFRPGFEREGAPILTDFMTRVRRLLDKAEQKRGHKIKLGARVPSWPQTAAGMGMDAVTWARKGLLDMLVVTPFLFIETDMPMELWKELLTGTGVTLAAGLDRFLLEYWNPPYPLYPENSLETARGAAISLLDRGADRIYLFNYFDATPETACDSDGAIHPRNYPTLLRELGSIETMIGKPRRHVITYSDTWAPGQPRGIALPATVSKDELKEFRIHIGPKPESGKIMVALGLQADAKITKKALEVRVNGDLCGLIGPVKLPVPGPRIPAYGFEVPLSTVKRGNNLIEILPQMKITVGWVEIKITS